MHQARHIGLIGLGVMGRNLALNMADHGFTVTATDPWPEARQSLVTELATYPQPERIRITPGVAELVAALPAPRNILLLVKAGATVDSLIAQLTLLLEPGDTLIDSGNSFYRDTMRRESELAAQGFHFIGLGISGGEEGARRGPAMMAGGDAAAYARIKPVLETIAAHYGDSPCCARVGRNGAGHFVKMVHNGIEYGIMQLIAEAYLLLRDLGGLDHGRMAATFRAWNNTELASYLIEITAEILDKQDELTGAPLVEMILDQAQQKGTGRWTSEAALEFGIPTPTLSEAVFGRALSALKAERLAAAEILPGPSPVPLKTDSAAFIESIRQALLGSIISCYAQGLALIEAAGRELDWQIELATVAGLWRAGCIIRADLLARVMTAYQTPGQSGNLLCTSGFAQLLATIQPGWRETAALAVTGGIPVPGLLSALAYFDGLRQPRSAANLIQAQRDYFGAHTYERTDRNGVFHTEWSQL